MSWAWISLVWVRVLEVLRRRRASLGVMGGCKERHESIWNVCVAVGDEGRQLVSLSWWAGSLMGLGLGLGEILSLGSFSYLLGPFPRLLQPLDCKSYGP